MLEELDYEISLASSGEEAIEILGRQTINVLCTDFQMPGMNGIELMQQAETVSPSTVGVLVTGYPDFASDCNADQHAQYLLLLKPFKPDDMVRILGQAVRFSKIRGSLGTVGA